MTDLVTDEMVEAAARAMDRAYNPERAPILAAMFRDYARAALEAAAPLIAAATLRYAPEHENRELSDYDDGIRESCPDHNPVQHRDGNPPWCPRCGLTAAMTEPVSRFKRNRADELEADRG